MARPRIPVTFDQERGFRPSIHHLAKALALKLRDPRFPYHSHARTIRLIAELKVPTDIPAKLITMEKASWFNHSLARRMSYRVKPKVDPDVLVARAKKWAAKLERKFNGPPGERLPI